MNTRMQSRFRQNLLVVSLAGLILLSACGTAVTATTLPESLTTPVPVVTSEPTAGPATDGSLQITLETGSMATDFQTETVAAVSAGDNAPTWEVLPEYTRVTLQGYPISNHLIKPQIFIYPMNELGQVNEGAGNIAATLQTLIQSPQEIATMPFLPLYNAQQVMHVQVQYLDFKNGQGMRFLTWYSQGIMPVNNYELIYTYQGLTSDGKYYVAAVLPVNHPSLPADGKVTGNEPPEFTSDYTAYIANVVKALNPEAANTFTPDLTQLDAMISTLEVK
jgi:hypothetical protein